MGLNVYVFKHPLGDCTNGGISSKAIQLCVVNVDGPFAPSDKIPAAMLCTGPYGDPIIRPATIDQLGSGEWRVDPKAWYMMGGNYAACSDSRFSEALKALGSNSYVAIPIHDRQE